MRSALIPVLLALLLVGSMVAVGASDAVSPIPRDDVDLSAPDRPLLVYDVSLATDGSAVWNVSIFFPTASEAEAEAFASVEESYIEDGGDEYLPIDPFEVTAADASDSLNRSMSIEGVARSTSESESAGVLSLTFTWAGFAFVDDPYIHVGDVFSATSEPWLTGLNEDEFFQIHPPDGYQVEDSGMQLANRSMWVAGPIDLTEANLQGRFVEEGADEEPNGTMSPAILGGLGLGTLVLAVFLAGAYHRGWRPFDVTETDESHVAATEPADEHTDSEEPAEEADEADLSLLSDEERVIQLIEANGGRMKQATIVEETDWSNAKVSQVLSSMADDGTVEKLRLGRENLISLPDETEK